MVSLIYTTLKNKKINIYIDNQEQVWVSCNDLTNLLDTTQEEISKQRKSLLYSDAENPICQEMIMAHTNERYYSIFLVLIIGKVINPKEAMNLMRWYNIMTEEHTIELSEEFNENLSKAINNNK